MWEGQTEIATKPGGPTKAAGFPWIWSRKYCEISDEFCQKPGQKPETQSMGKQNTAGEVPKKPAPAHNSKSLVLILGLDIFKWLNKYWGFKTGQNYAASNIRPMTYFQFRIQVLLKPESSRIPKQWPCIPASKQPNSAFGQSASVHKRDIWVKGYTGAGSWGECLWPLHCPHAYTPHVAPPFFLLPPTRGLCTVGLSFGDRNDGWASNEEAYFPNELQLRIIMHEPEIELWTVAKRGRAVFATFRTDRLVSGRNCHSPTVDVC